MDQRSGTCVMPSQPKGVHCEKVSRDLSGLCKCVNCVVDSRHGYKFFLPVHSHHANATLESLIQEVEFIFLPLESELVM